MVDVPLPENTILTKFDLKEWQSNAVTVLLPKYAFFDSKSFF